MLEKGAGERDAAATGEYVPGGEKGEVRGVKEDCVKKERVRFSEWE